MVGTRKSAELFLTVFINCSRRIGPSSIKCRELVMVCMDSRTSVFSGLPVADEEFYNAVALIYEVGTGFGGTFFVLYITLKTADLHISVR